MNSHKQKDKEEQSLPSINLQFIGVFALEFSEIGNKILYIHQKMIIFYYQFKSAIATEFVRVA